MLLGKQWESSVGDSAVQEKFTSTDYSPCQDFAAACYHASNTAQ